MPPGVSFSISRALGIDRIKRGASQNLGIPLSKQARQRKAGTQMGCCVVLALPLAGLGVAAIRMVEALK